MFTKSDITQLRSIIKEDVTGIIQEEVPRIIDERVPGILDKKLKPVKKDLNYLKKTVSLIAKNYDEGDVKLGIWVTRIEEYLYLPNNR